MMNSKTFRLVLLVSCAHALVHVYEHSFASIEQLVAVDPAFGIASEAQTRMTGMLGSSLRLPFGMCALLVGWLADRFGTKRLLLIYLIGASAACAMNWFAPDLGYLFFSMFTLGVFASIYHPAGVGLISLSTTPENRTMALGYHGIFGSAGIAAGPFLAGLALSFGADWRQYYLLLTIPGVLLAVLIMARLSHEHNHELAGDPNSVAPNDDDGACWKSYSVLMVLASLAGFVYAAILTFMPRYIDGAGLVLAGIPREALRNYLTGGILLLGVLGQYTAGRIARPTTLEPLLAVAFFLAVPCILWMGFAQGTARLWAAGLFAPVFFMHQPLFNSLVAKYVPRRRRSLCYGLSFTVGFGIGSLGPTFSGYAGSGLANFGTLAGVLLVAAFLGLLLWRWNRPIDES